MRDVSQVNALRYLSRIWVLSADETIAGNARAQMISSDRIFNDPDVTTKSVAVKPLNLVDFARFPTY